MAVLTPVVVLQQARYDYHSTAGFDIIDDKAVSACEDLLEIVQLQASRTLVPEGKRLGDLRVAATPSRCD